MFFAYVSGIQVENLDVHSLTSMPASAPVSNSMTVVWAEDSTTHTLGREGGEFLQQRSTVFPNGLQNEAKWKKTSPLTLNVILHISLILLQNFYKMGMGLSSFY